MFTWQIEKGKETFSRGKMKVLLLLSIGCVLSNPIFAIYGGCMSYSTTRSSITGHIQVLLH